MTGWVTVATILAYGIALLSTGVFLARGRADPERFFLAGRTLGTVGVFSTMFSTFLGTGLLFTLAAFGYRYGVGAFVLIGAAAAGLLLLGWAAPRINRLSDREGAITLPELFDRRWSERTQALAALVTVGLFTGTLAANILVVGEVLRTLAGLPSTPVVVGFAVTVVGYTVLGGFRGVVWTDVAQLVLIVVAFALVLPAAVFVVADPVTPSSLPQGHLDPRSFPLPVAVAYLLVGAFAFFGSQDLLQRIFAARDPTTARRGVLLFTALLGVVGSAAVGLGIVARVVVSDASADGVLVSLTSAVVPAGSVALVLLGFLALANSDADSQLLTVASNVTQDLLPHLNADLDRRQRTVVDRVAVAGIGAIALGVALAAPGLTALFSAVGSWFAILGFVVLATLYWDRMSDRAAFGGLLVGFIVPPAFVAVTGDVQAATFAGFVPAVVVVGVVSLLTGTAMPAGSSDDGAVETIR